MERNEDRGEDLIEVEGAVSEKAIESMEVEEKEENEEKTEEIEKHEVEKEKSDDVHPINSKIDAAAKMTESLTVTRLVVRNLTRNVTEEHLRLIFSVWGPLKNAEIIFDQAVRLPRGFGYIEFEKSEDAENALDHMNGGQIDGNIVEVCPAQQPKKREVSPAAVPSRQVESIRTQRTDRRSREADRRRSPPRYHRRSPIRRTSRSPPRRRSPYRHRSRSPPRRNYNGGYAYGNRGVSPIRRRSRPPYRGRRRSPSPRYRRREPARGSPSKRSRRSSSSGSSSMSKSSTGSSSSASSSGSSSK